MLHWRVSVPANDGIKDALPQNRSLTFYVVHSSHYSRTKFQYHRLWILVDCAFVLQAGIFDEDVQMAGTDENQILMTITCLLLRVLHASRLALGRRGMESPLVVCKHRDFQNASTEPSITPEMFEEHERIVDISKHGAGGLIYYEHECHD